ncbi:MAG: FAD-dependent oxidoreductase [Gemmatimonadaceae bacterium]
MVSETPLTRRTALKTFGAALAVGVTACSDRRSVLVDRTGQPGHRRRFEPVDMTAGRHVRSTVGLRPYRPSGFRVEAERLDGKQLIHCYGHGGGGITLSWGTANLAVGLLSAAPTPGPIAVIGAGVIGLTISTLLQRLGYDVTIYAAAAWPHTTSNASAATFGPSHVLDSARATPQFTSDFESALRRSYHAFQRLTGHRYGIRWYDAFFLSNGQAQPPSEPDVESQVMQRVVGSGASRQLNRDEHPFAASRVTQGRDLIIEPMTYLRQLLDDFYLAGGRLRIRKFGTLRDVAQLTERAVFNATGLGSRELVGDKELRAARGQLCVMPPQPGVDYTLYHGPFYYMVPREDGIILGGTFQLDNESTTASTEDDTDILGAHKAVFDAMR